MKRFKINVKTNGNTDIINITEKIKKILENLNVESGVVNLFVVGSTTGLSVYEADAMLESDIKQAFETMAPKNKYYHHHEKWHDDNGHSHVRATLLKPDLNIPFENKKLMTGTWQQVILIDFDTKPRNREVIVTVFEK